MTEPLQPKEPQSDILLYQTEDGNTRLSVRLEDETVWLTQSAVAELFQTTTQNITTHIKSIYNDCELDEAATCKEYLQVQKEGTETKSNCCKIRNSSFVIG